MESIPSHCNEISMVTLMSGSWARFQQCTQCNIFFTRAPSTNKTRDIFSVRSSFVWSHSHYDFIRCLSRCLDNKIFYYYLFKQTIAKIKAKKFSSLIGIVEFSSMAYLFSFNFLLKIFIISHS